MQSIVHAYWNAIHELRFQDVRELFCDTAEITWPNTEEVFTLDEFIAVNEAYPGEWEEEVLKCTNRDMIISETMVKGWCILRLGFFITGEGKSPPGVLDGSGSCPGMEKRAVEKQIGNACIPCFFVSPFTELLPAIRYIVIV
ncbi:MAG: hypothetical protein ACLTJG_18715 [[Clostridium] innocuum]